MKDKLKSSCPICGNIILKGANQCPDCGARLTEPGSYDPSEDPTDHVKRLHSKDSFTTVMAILMVAVILASLFTYALVIIVQDQSNGQDNTIPFVVKTEPNIGDLLVSPEPTIRIYFSEPMFPSSNIHLALFDINTQFANTTWIDDHTVEISNLRLYHFGNNTISLTNYHEAEIRDLTGNSFVGQYKWWFVSRPVNIEVLSANLYRNNGSNTHFVYGEIKNHENYNLTLGSFEVTTYDKNESILSLSDRGVRAYPDTVKPGEIVPFSGHIFHSNETMDSFNIRLKDPGIEFADRYDELEIPEHEGNLISQGNDTQYMVNGTILNNGTEQALLTSVTGVFYDSEDNIICVKNWIIGLDYLEPNSTIEFEMQIYDSECELTEIVRYNLWAHESF